MFGRHCRILLIVGVICPGLAEAQDLMGFIRGDCNADGATNVSDPTYLLEDLFGAGTSGPCRDACDTNDDGRLDLADVVLLLGHVFNGNPAAFAEPSTCGIDPTPDALDCAVGTCVVGPLVGDRSFTLETAREGLPYSGDLPAEQQAEFSWAQGFNSGVIQDAIPFVEYGIALDGALPGDLVLDPATGVITGTTVPQGLHSFPLWGRNAAGEYTRFQVDLPAFSAAESEIIAGQGLTGGGSFLVSIQEESFDYTHPLPWPVPYPLYACNTVQPPTADFTELKNVRIFYPLFTTQPTPVLIFHHGTGYDWTSYQQLMIHLASHGITCVTVNDQYPYFAYTDYYCWGGHEESARVLLETRAFIEMLDGTPGHPIFGTIDWNRLFYSGHSRGGAAALMAVELDPDVRGVITLQGTDARRDAWIGHTNRWIDLPDVPVLSITAEQDTDVFYPFSERLIERFRGPATMVTIYGGCHAYSTDASVTGCQECVWNDQAPAVDNCRYITRATQLLWTKRYVTAFMKRYGHGDLTVEGLLYGEENEGSPYVGVSVKRNLSGTMTVADFTDFPLANRGGQIQATNTLLFIEGPCYDWPFPTPAPIDPISNLVLIADPNGVTTVDIPILEAGVPLDTTGAKVLTFRLKNHDIHGVPDNIGYGHLSLDVQLADSLGNQAIVSADPHLPQIAVHPEPEPPTLTVPMKYQRFITVTIPIADFVAANPAFDPTLVAGLRYTITTNGTNVVDVRLGIDDVQFE